MFFCDHCDHLYASSNDFKTHIISERGREESSIFLFNLSALESANGREEREERGERGERGEREESGIFLFNLSAGESLCKWAGSTV